MYREVLLSGVEGDKRLALEQREGVVTDGGGGDSRWVTENPPA